MALHLEPADRSNWRQMVELKLRDEQEIFVASPVKSLAMCYVRAWGDEYDYLPFVIRAANSTEKNPIVGYVTLVCDPLSVDDYWIDDIMIDAAHQGKGFGREALNMVLRLIAGKYPRCEKIRLTCFRGNFNAAALYLSVGFVKTGNLTQPFSEPEYALSGAVLTKFRS